jgi:cyclopropane-fatty-acyl-phospholipid synthase
VGEANWPTYFKVLHDRLKPGGSAAVQAITISEAMYPRYRRKTDFIQRYIFPGGMLPTKTILAEQAARAGLTFATHQTFGQDYARTLDMWHKRFEAAWTAISPLGFDEAFRRRWRYYLCYCEAGFAEGSIDVGVYRFTRSA